MDRYRSESKLKVTRKFRDSSHVDEATLWRTLGRLFAFSFSRGSRYPARCRSPYCTAVVVKNTRMQVLQKVQ